MHSFRYAELANLSLKSGPPLDYGVVIRRPGVYQLMLYFTALVLRSMPTYQLSFIVREQRWLLSGLRSIWTHPSSSFRYGIRFGWIKRSHTPPVFTPLLEQRH